MTEKLKFISTNDNFIVKLPEENYLFFIMDFEFTIYTIVSCRI